MRVTRWRRRVGASVLAVAFAWRAPALAADRRRPPPSEARPAAAAPPAAPDDPQLAPPPGAPRTLRSWEEALATVRAQSPDYLAAVDAALRAEAQSRAALAAVLPGLDAQGSFTHQLLTSRESLGAPGIELPLQDVWSATGTLVWNVGNPRAYHALGTADRNLAATRSDLAERRRVIAQAVVSAMLATLAAERVAELNRVGLRAALERLALAEARASLGSATVLDVDRARQDVTAARAPIITGDEALRQSREALGVALGSSVPTAAPGDLDLELFERAVASTCRMNEEIERRPDVVAARARLDVADRAVDDVRLQYLPWLSFQSQLAWGSQVLNGPDTIWSLKAVLNVPIWDGGLRAATLRDARAAADQARQALIGARLGALVGVAQATRAVDVSRASRAVAQEQRELALRVDRSTRDGFEHGLGTSLDLVTSAQLLRQAELNLALLQFQAAQARVLAILANADCLY